LVVEKKVFGILWPHKSKPFGGELAVEVWRGIPLARAVALAPLIESIIEFGFDRIGEAI
jgi:hypothetical protein